MEARIQRARKVFKEVGGLARTSELVERGIHYRYLRYLLESGYVAKTRHGFYSWIEDAQPSDAAIISKLFPDAILCMDTALSYYDYTDRTPSAWHLSVDKDCAKTRFALEYPSVKPHYLEPDRLLIGESSGDIDGVSMRIYDRERTICDCFSHRNKMDREVFNSAVRGYVKDKQKNVPRLMRYARKLRVEKPVREVLGAWL